METVETTLDPPLATLTSEKCYKPNNLVQLLMGYPFGTLLIGKFSVSHGNLISCDYGCDVPYYIYNHSNTFSMGKRHTITCFA